MMRYGFQNELNYESLRVAAPPRGVATTRIQAVLNGKYVAADPGP
jgi:hypothetical protein